MRREPARVVCVACGHELVVIGATDDQYHAQRRLDAALRPRSAECLDHPPTPPDMPGFAPPVPRRRLWGP